jgi:hypothetical protein
LRLIAAVGEGWCVGKHVRRILNLEPGAKPRYRFVVALGAIVLLAFATMAVVATIFPENAPQASADPDPFSGDPTFGDPTVEPHQTNGTSPEPGSGFQAQINMTNTTVAPQAWEVRLVFDESVTGLVSSWVDGQPKPAEQAVDRAYTLTGMQAIPPGQTVVLRVQFDKLPNTDFAVRECTINGRPCAQ